MSVLEPSAFDERAWQRIKLAYGDIQESITLWERHRPEAGELMQDLFFAFFQREPVLQDTATGSVAQIVGLALAHQTWSATRELVGDDTMHAIIAAFTVFHHVLRAGLEIESGVTAGLKEVRDAIERVRAFQASFRQSRAPMTIEQQSRLAYASRHNPKLARIAQIAGRLKKVAAKVHASRVDDKRDDVYDIVLGDKLPQVLPGELGLLACMQPSFLHKYSERRLMQREVGGDEQVGQGPIIVAIDSSGSMVRPAGIAGYTREEWAKAIMLGLAEIAALEKRDLAVIHFGGTMAELKVWEFKAGTHQPDELLACADHFYAGSTIFDGWIREALRLVDNSRWNKADVIVLSDGGAHVSEAQQVAWDTRRKQRGLRCYGIMIGVANPGGLTFIADRIISMKGGNEDEVTSAIFGI
jgi:uncharacterized protein with von Willebrand factor type A (vWA) domain